MMKRVLVFSCKVFVSTYIKGKISCKSKNEELKNVIAAKLN